jgi:hypothetical protein
VNALFVVVVVVVVAVVVVVLVACNSFVASLQDFVDIVEFGQLE